MGKKTESFSILDQGLVLEGTVSFKGKMIIKGTVRGTLEGETVVIGEEGSVYADVKAGSVTVGGIFEGKLRAMTELVVLSTGNCEGKVVCKDLVVEPGGVLNAEVSCLALHGDKAMREEILPDPFPKSEDNKKVLSTITTADKVKK